jgi:putative nucleotidyltransferase with HDIG domain
MMNPFFNRGPIRDSRFYFGRPRETREVARLVAGAQNCSIVGPVKSGKTSFLLHLARPETLAAHDLSPDQHIPVYLSFEGLATLTPEQFFQMMLQGLAAQTRGQMTVVQSGAREESGLSFLGLRDALAHVESTGKRLVFLLDEVELAATNPAFDLNFFSALRHLAARPGTCFVTATGRRLHEIGIADREIGSPFADLFSVVRLRPLDPDSAWRQVEELAGAAGADLSADRDFVIRLAGEWPYYLQVVAYEAFECKSGRGALSEGEQWYVQSRAREQLDPVLTMMWDRLSASERDAALGVLAEGRAVQPVDGLTAASDGGVRPANALVAQFLAERQRDGAERVEDYFQAEYAAPAVASPKADRQALYGVVRALMRAVEARDRYARGHADRVARLAVAIAKEMGCPDEMSDGLRVAARLHDIGRVSVSDMILLKPGPLTELETKIMRTHPLVGAQILDALEFPWSVKPAVRYHHERLDGSGYPEGLMGEEIPLGARIVAVADVVAAMTADRPHRQALTEEEALAELVANAGEKYDSQVVAALERALERGLA